MKSRPRVMCQCHEIYEKELETVIQTETGDQTDFFSNFLPVNVFLMICILRPYRFASCFPVESVHVTLATVNSPKTTFIEYLMSMYLRRIAVSDSSQPY